MPTLKKMFTIILIGLMIDMIWCYYRMMYESHKNGNIFVDVGKIVVYTRNINRLWFFITK